MKKIYYEVECWFNGYNFDGGEHFNSYKEAKKSFNEIIKENNRKIQDLKENLKEYGQEFTKECIENWGLIDFIQINRHDEYYGVVDMMDNFNFFDDFDDLKEMIYE